MKTIEDILRELSDGPVIEEGYRPTIWTRLGGARHIEGQIEEALFKLDLVRDAILILAKQSGRTCCHCPSCHV